MTITHIKLNPTQITHTNFWHVQMTKRTHKVKQQQNIIMLQCQSLCSSSTQLTTTNCLSSKSSYTIQSFVCSSLILCFFYWIICNTIIIHFHTNTHHIIIICLIIDITSSYMQSTSTFYT